MDAIWLRPAGKTAGCEQLPVFFLTLIILISIFKARWNFCRAWNSTVIYLAVDKDSYLVDPASSHMLVSKIKPCMSKYKQFIQ